MTWSLISRTAGITDCSIVDSREARKQRTTFNNEANSPKDVGRQLREFKLRLVSTRKPLNPATEHRKTREINNYFCGTLAPLGPKLPSYSLRTNSVRDRSKL